MSRNRSHLHHGDTLKKVNQQPPSADTWAALPNNLGDALSAQLAVVRPLVGDVDDLEIARALGEFGKSRQRRISLIKATGIVLRPYIPRGLLFTAREPAIKNLLDMLAAALPESARDEIRTRIPGPVGSEIARKDESYLVLGAIATLPTLVAEEEATARAFSNIISRNPKYSMPAPVLHPFPIAAMSGRETFAASQFSAPGQHATFGPPVLVCPDPWGSNAGDMIVRPVFPEG